MKTSTTPSGSMTPLPRAPARGYGPAASRPPSARRSGDPARAEAHRQAAAPERTARGRARGARRAGWVGLAAVLSWAATAWALPQDDPKPDEPAAGEAPRERVIDVVVVESAGGNAYIRPGEQAGLRSGQEVNIGRKKFRVMTVSRDHAIIDIGEARVREGDTGKARVRVRRGDEPVLPPTVPLSEYEGQWTPPTVPAEDQNPVRVPLGSGSDQGAYRVALRAGFSSVVSGGRSYGRVSLGAAMSAEPWQEVPFGVDADVALAYWLGDGVDTDLGADSRSILFVRELQLRYGDRVRPYVGLGRLRYAATTLGLLDGVRLSSPTYNGAQVSVFGGVVPSTLDGTPDFDHRRFGVEATFTNPDVPWQPFLTVVAHGSLFEGDLDERRLASYATVRQGPLAVSGHAELSFFDEDNPWGVAPLELTAAGVDAQLRWGNTRVGARVDLRQPERSLWLASLLPPSWLCSAEPQPPPSPGEPASEPCSDTRDLRYAAAFDGQVDLGRLSLSAGATAIGISNGDDIETVSAFADVRVVEILDRYRAHVGGFVSSSPLFDSTAVRVSGGGPMPFLDALELSLFYRPALIVYNASVEDYLDHRVGVDALYMPLPRLDLALTVEAMFGDDTSGLGAFATAVWRPQL